MSPLTMIAIGLMLVFSMFAFLNDTGDDVAAVEPTPPTPSPPTRAGARTQTTPPPTVETALASVDAVEREIQERVMARVRETRIDLNSFSRARIPQSRTVHYQIERPPSERKVFVEFTVYESLKRSRGLPLDETHLAPMPARLLEEGKVRAIAVGHVDRRNGRIEMRLANGGSERYLPLEDALKALGASRERGLRVRLSD